MVFGNWNFEVSSEKRSRSQPAAQAFIVVVGVREQPLLSLVHMQETGSPKMDEPPFCCILALHAMPAARTVQYCTLEHWF